MIEAFLRVIFPEEKVVVFMNILYDVQTKKASLHRKHRNKKIVYSNELFRDVICVLDIICVSYNQMSVIGNLLNITVHTTLLDNFCHYCVINEYYERMQDSVAEEVAEVCFCFRQTRYNRENNYLLRVYNL